MAHKITKDFLIEQFLILKKTRKKIASELKCSLSTVKSYLNKYEIRRPKKDRWEGFIGKVFGRWKIIGEADGYKRKSYIVRCSCGVENIVDANSLVCGTSTGCRSCSNGFGVDHHNWKGYKEISGTTWQQIIRGAKKRNLEFTITLPYVWNLYLLQERRCKLSDVPIELNRKNITASLDRIDSGIGYVEGNVQWVHKWVNFMKQDLDQEDFLEFCCKIVRNMGRIR